MEFKPDRRDFSAMAAAAPMAFQGAGGKRKLCVIGATGRGDWGHGLDTSFSHRPDIELVAVADASPAGLKKAADRLKAPKSYADFREMLSKEKPEFVVVAPRHCDQHLAMGMAAVEAGAHIYMEKPFMPSPADGDTLLKAADAKGLRIAVAHQMRMEPAVTELRKAIASGAIGDLLEIRAWGKQDNARAGGEDMIVLGSHLFDLMRLFAGDVLWCRAGVTLAGRDISKADARMPKDNVGPVAGDEVNAQFGFAKGVIGSFTSRARLREAAGPWGLELIGAKGAARVAANIPTQVYLRPQVGWSADGGTVVWKKPAGPATAGSFALANARLVDDLVAAADSKRDPECSGRNAMKAIEMVMAVYRASLTGSKVTLPLAERGHPLAS